MSYTTQETQAPTLPVIPHTDAPITYQTVTTAYAPTHAVSPYGVAPAPVKSGRRVSPLERVMAFVLFVSACGLVFIPIGVQLGKQSAAAEVLTSQEEKAAATQALQRQSAQIEAFCKAAGR